MFAIGLIVAFDANIDRLIQLYIIGVFTSFTLSQAGMVRHWSKLMLETTSRGMRASLRRSQAINAIGAVMTGVVLVIVAATKIGHGAWLAVVGMVGLFLIMRGIRRHYDHVAAELDVDAEAKPVLPSRNHAIVLVSRIHLPTLRALAYARATAPSSIEAVTVSVDPEETEALRQEWITRDLRVPLTILDSPYREIGRPVVDYVRRLRRESPRDVVTVFVPEYVLGHWWEQLLHNQSALRLKSRLLFTPGVMVTSVPWQLRSSRERDLTSR